tara:strand:- start:526 stop:1101 length:576 start_codon:yes stop_codon:yes gene_type:complete
MIALAILIAQICPPPLISFDTHREVLSDGWTHTTGGAAYETRVIEVDYFDNRDIVTISLQSQGQVTLTNVSHGFMPEIRRVKYHQKIDVPRGDYIVSQGHSTYDYEVCAEDGKVTLYVEKSLARQDPYTQEWLFTVEIEPWGDLDGDGCINGSDLGFFFSGWGMPGATDFNEDGVTDGQDLGILLDNWNHC